MSPQDLGADTKQNNGLNRSSTLLSKTRSLQDFIYFKKRRIRSEHKVRTLCSQTLLQNISYLESHEGQKLQQIKKLVDYHYCDNSIHTTKYTALSFLPKKLVRAVSSFCKHLLRLYCPFKFCASNRCHSAFCVYDSRNRYISCPGCQRPH